MLALTFSRLLTPSQNRLINVAAFGTPAIENLLSTSFTPRRITPPSVFAKELYDSHRASGKPPDASLHSVWTTSPCFTSRSICLAVNFIMCWMSRADVTNTTLPHGQSLCSLEMVFKPNPQNAVRIPKSTPRRKADFRKSAILALCF